MATALSEKRKKAIRDKLKAKVKTAGYTKGHVARTKDKKISDVKIKKKDKPAALKKTDKNYAKKKAARTYAQAHKKAMHSDTKKATTKKSYAQAARKGAQVSHAKKVGKASVAAGKPKGPGLKYTAANKSWRKTAMAAAKKKTGPAKKKAMQAVDRKYRKKVGLKPKTYS
jgi:hypothetical protein